jgi:hypothetical protein
MTRKEEQLRKAMLHYLEGSIHPEELEVLNRVVEADPQARREMAELMLQDALLTKVGQETEFFELDQPRPVPPAAVSCRTSRIMKITRRAPVVEAPSPKPSPRRVLIAAAAILFTVSVATAVTLLRPSESEPVTTVMPIVPAAPAAVAPPEEPPAEAPAKAVVNAPAAPKPAPAKAKAPAAKPKTSTARKEPADSRPQTTTVPDGFLNLPQGKAPPSSSKPAPKLPPKPPPAPPPAQKNSP